MEWVGEEGEYLPIFLETSRTPTAVSAKRLVGVMMRRWPFDPDPEYDDDPYCWLGSLANVSWTQDSIDRGRILVGVAEDFCAVADDGKVPSRAWCSVIGDWG